MKFIAPTFFAIASLSACGGGGTSASTSAYVLPPQAINLGQAIDQKRDIQSRAGNMTFVRQEYPTMGNVTYIGIADMQFQYNRSQDSFDVQGQTTITIDFAGNDVDGTIDTFVVTQGFGVNDADLANNDPNLDRDQPVIPVVGSLEINGFIDNGSSAFAIDMTGVGDLSFDTAQDGAVLIEVDTPIRGQLNENDAFIASSLAFTNDTNLTIDGVLTNEVGVRVQVAAVPE